MGNLIKRYFLWVDRSGGPGIGVVLVALPLAILAAVISWAVGWMADFIGVVGFGAIVFGVLWLVGLVPIWWVCVTKITRAKDHLYLASGPLFPDGREAVLIRVENAAVTKWEEGLWGKLGRDLRLILLPKLKDGKQFELLTELALPTNSATIGRVHFRLRVLVEGAWDNSERLNALYCLFFNLFRSASWVSLPAFVEELFLEAASANEKVRQAFRDCGTAGDLVDLLPPALRTVVIPRNEAGLLGITGVFVLKVVATSVCFVNSTVTPLKIE